MAVARAIPTYVTLQVPTGLATNSFPAMSANATAAASGSASPKSEPRWPAALAVLVAMGLWVSLPSNIILGVDGATALRVIVPVLALALLIPLTVAAPHRHVDESGRRRKVSIAVTAIVTVANAAALVFLIHYLLTAGAAVHGKGLLLAGAEVWWTNVIIFALWFWELDGGGSSRSPSPRSSLWPTPRRSSS